MPTGGSPPYFHPSKYLWVIARRASFHPFSFPDPKQIRSYKVLKVAPERHIVFFNLSSSVLLDMNRETQPSLKIL